MERQITLSGGGQLGYTDAGAMVHFNVVRPDDQTGLYKAWIFGAHGRMLLGTLIPEEGRLHLRRTVSRRTLEMNGCYPFIGGETAMAFSFQNRQRAQETGWRWESQAEHYLSDPLLQECARKWGKFRHKIARDGFYLAVPIKIQGEFPLIPIFCLGQLMTIEGTPHIFWEFDKKGIPVLPHKKTDHGT